MSQSVSVKFQCQKLGKYVHSCEQDGCDIATMALLSVKISVGVENFSVKSCENMSRVASKKMVATKALLSQWWPMMISAISNLSSEQQTQHQLQRVPAARPGGQVRPASFLAYVASAKILVRRPHQTGRPSVPSAVEVGEEEGPHLELGSPARLRRALPRRNGVGELSKRGATRQNADALRWPCLR